MSTGSLQKKKLFCQVGDPSGIVSAVNNARNGELSLRNPYVKGQNSHEHLCSVVNSLSFG